jgi:hypothetical protein
MLSAILECIGLHLAGADPKGDRGVQRGEQPHALIPGQHLQALGQPRACPQEQVRLLESALSEFKSVDSPLASKAKLSESREFYRRRSKALPNSFTGIGWCSVLLKRLRGQRPANRKYCHGFRFLRNFWAHCAHFENWDIVPPWPL